MKKIIILLTLLASLIPARVYAAGKVIYVSTSGNDQNGCTQASPCRSIAHGIAVAASGDTVSAAAGVYRENVAVSKSITLVGSGAVIDGTGLGVQNGGGLINIPAGVVATVQGFEVRNGGTYGISVFSNGSTISGNVIHDIKGAGVWMRDGKYNVFENNEIYRTVLDNASGASCSPTATGWASAINSWGGASNNIWRNNYVHDNCGEGMVVYYGDLVDGNTFKDNWSVEIYIVDGFTTVRNNTITDTKPYIVRGSDQSWRAVPSGISIGDESVCRVTDNVISGNKINGSRYGVSFYAFPATAGCTGLKNTTISGNTISNAREYGLRILTGNHANTSITNNTINVSGAVARPLTIQSGAFLISGNIFFADTPIFEFNGKTYTGFTAWLAAVPGNVWGVPTVIATDTPAPTGTPTAVGSSVPTATASPVPTSTPTATVTPTVVPLSLLCVNIVPTVNINGVGQSKLCFMP